MTQDNPVVIVSAARTPMGGFQGLLSGATAAELGSVAIGSALERGNIAPETVDEVIMGCVLPAGQGQAPARQAALGAGLPVSSPCTTVNKMCGSGMKAVMMGCDSLAVNNCDTIVAGGMESMSNAPYLIPKARQGLRMGHGQLMDHMFLDGLEDAYEPGRLMGTYAEDTARHYQITREAQDEFAIRSLTRARAAMENGTAAFEIAPVNIKARRYTATVDTDEQPQKANLDKIPTLRPAFAKDGTVTAANSSSISDGAAALVLMRERDAEAQGLQPRARILGHSTFAHEPRWFTTAPVYAIERLLQKLSLETSNIDLYEINEAFAVVAMVAIQELGLDTDQVNVNGGACALGHPIGASGARILVTLLNALEQQNLKTGIGSLCIGGGEAVAVAIERL